MEEEATFNISDWYYQLDTTPTGNGNGDGVGDDDDDATNYEVNDVLNYAANDATNYAFNDAINYAANDCISYTSDDTANYAFNDAISYSANDGVNYAANDATNYAFNYAANDGVNYVTDDAADDAANDAADDAADDSRAPTDPAKLFAWICAQNWPQIEDELPPPGFDEVDEMPDIVYRCERCDGLIISMDTCLVQCSIGTQTTDTADTQQLDGQTQTEGLIIQELEEQRQLNRELEQQLLELEEDLDLELMPLPIEYTQPQPSFSVARSLSAILKTLLVLISVLHGCYLLSEYICRLPVLRNLMWRAQAICAPIPPPPPRSLPAFIWTQLCRLAHRLHFI